MKLKVTMNLEFGIYNSLFCNKEVYRIVCTCLFERKNHLEFINVCTSSMVHPNFLEKSIFIEKRVGFSLDMAITEEKKCGMLLHSYVILFNRFWIFMEKDPAKFLHSRSKKTFYIYKSSTISLQVAPCKLSP